MIVKGNITIVYPEKVYAAEAANVDAPESPTFAARRIAAALARKIDNYHIPAAVKKKTGINSLSEISERWLIACCTAEAKNDDGIQAEIDEFIKQDLREHIIPVLISGSPEESFPYELLHVRKEDGTVIDVEPLAANLAAPDIKESIRKLDVEALRIFAPMLGVSFDELNRRDLRRKRRILYSIGAAVIAVAAGFLIYSLDKVKTISAQNRQISELYSEKKQAEEDMENQKNEAVYQNQLLLCRKARNALDEYDVQLAIEYCLEGFDRDDPESSIDELKEAFNDAIEIACAEGYVPITGEKEYNRQNDIDLLNVYDLYYPDGGYEKEYQEELPEDIRKFIEKENEIDLSGKKLMADCRLIDYSERYGYAIYDVLSYKDTDLKKNFYGNKIHFKNHPEDDYYLKDRDGQYIYLSYITAWEDGTFMGEVYNSPAGYVRFDALTGEWLEELGYHDTFSSFNYTDDRRYIIGLSDDRKTFEVYNPETRGLLHTVTRSWGKSISYTDYTLDDGRTYILFYAGKVYVYNLANGKERIFETDDTRINKASISNEGLVLVSGDNIGKVYDIESGELVAEFPNTSINYGGTMWFHGKKGKYNLVRGAECIDTGNIIFEYHENSTPIPEILEDKIELAEGLIAKRKNNTEGGQNGS